MNDLPEEVVLHIFRFVSDEDLIRVIPLVCKGFNRLSVDNSLWIPRWKNWRHNGGQAFLEHSYHNYIYMMRVWQDWLRNLRGDRVNSTLTGITIVFDNKETVVHFPFYIPRLWIETLKN